MSSSLSSVDFKAIDPQTPSLESRDYISSSRSPTPTPRNQSSCDSKSIDSPSSSCAYNGYDPLISSSRSPSPTLSPTPTPTILTPNASRLSSENNSPICSSSAQTVTTSTVATTVISSSSSSASNSEGPRNRHFTQVIKPKDDQTSELVNIKKSNESGCCSAVEKCCCCCSRALSTSSVLHAVKPRSPSMDRH